MKLTLGLLILIGLAGCGGSDGDSSVSTGKGGANQRANKPLSRKAAAAKKNMAPEQLSVGDPIENSLGMVFVPIPAGEFLLGNDGGANLHRVRLSDNFHIGVYEVTQEQYEKVTGQNPSEKKGPANPVEKVSWNDAMEFCKMLSELPKERAAGRTYRLPTEAEWEYACRAGTTTAFSFGDSHARLPDYAWYGFQNRARQTARSGKPASKAKAGAHPVGLKKPNPWGLYDIHGNVDEWVMDSHGAWPEGPVEFGRGGGKANGNSKGKRLALRFNPRGHWRTKGVSKIPRGGNWQDSWGSCGSSSRKTTSASSRFDSCGFRIVIAPAFKQPAATDVIATLKQNMKPAQLSISDPVVNSIGMALLPIPAGQFQMGSPRAEQGRPRGRDIESLHAVKLTKSFYIGAYEVTQYEYSQVTGKNPTDSGGPRFPVENVGWSDAVRFCRFLSALPKEKAAGHVYRLPTEAEWEYACRAGSSTAFSFGNNASRLPDYSWLKDNASQTAHPVGLKKPNSWGLFDMHGNVREWTADLIHFYDVSKLNVDPEGRPGDSPQGRVFRGGSYKTEAKALRSAARVQHRSRFIDRLDAGFRVVRVMATADGNN